MGCCGSRELARREPKETERLIGAVTATSRPDHYEDNESAQQRQIDNEKTQHAFKGSVESVDNALEEAEDVGDVPVSTNDERTPPQLLIRIG